MKRQSFFGSLSKSLFVSLLFIFQQFSVTSGLVNRADFLPFGESNGDTLLPAGDDDFVGVALTYPLKFLNQTGYSALFISTNGIISFIQGIDGFTPTCDSGTAPSIIPFFADADTTQGGSIYFRESIDRAVLNVALEKVLQGFELLYLGISLKSAFIVTFVDIPFFGATNCGALNLRNTFQTVITTDGVHTFVLFFYETITWTTGRASDGDCAGTGGSPAKAGFDTGDGLSFFQLPGSCTSDVINLASSTNVNSAGQFVFQVDSSIVSPTCGVSQYFGGMRIEPAFVGQYGHVPLILEGPCFSNATNLTCHILDRTQPSTPKIVGPGIITDAAANQAICILPYTNSYAANPIFITMDVNGVQQRNFWGMYSVEPTEDLALTLSGSDIPDTVNMTWDPAFFGGAPTTQLDLVLVESINGTSWTDICICISVNNSGAYTGPINITCGGSSSSAYTFRLTPHPSTMNGIPASTTFSPSAFSAVQYLGSRNPSANIAACQSWYDSDPGPSTDVLHCPPSLSQIQKDRFFEETKIEPLNTGAEHSFRQRVPSPSGAGQECNYKNGEILNTIPGGGGNVDNSSPIAKRGLVQHSLQDVVPRLQCCEFSEDNGESCRKFTEKRPSDTGASYAPPSTAKASGALKVTTFDGLSYQFCGAGEYWMIRSPEMVMEGRMEPYRRVDGTIAATSVLTSVVMTNRRDLLAAFGENNATRVQVSLGPAGFYVHYNQKLIIYDGRPYPDNTFVLYGLSFMLVTPTELQIAFSTGFAFLFTTADQNTALNVLVQSIPAWSGQVDGLFGYFDGDNGSNDLRAANGSTIPSDASAGTICSDFAKTWRVNESESIFEYPSGLSYSSFKFDEFVGNTESISCSEVSQACIDACEGSIECCTTCALTYSTLLVEETRIFEAEYLSTVSTLSEPVPMCQEPGVILNGFFQFINLLVGSNVTFGCELGYVLVGSASAQCLEISPSITGWSEPPPTCSLYCSKPQTLNNGNIVPDEDIYLVGSNVTFNCASGYTLVGNSTAQCQVTSSNTTEWSHPTPTCNLYCTGLETPSNGYVAPDQDIYLLGSNVTFGCDSNFTIIGNVSSECQLTSSNTTAWSHPAPTCSLYCSKPESRNHGSITPNQDKYLVGSNVTFACDSNYTLVGNMSAECKNSSSTTAAWTHPSPTCSQYCTKPQKPSHGYISPDQELYLIGSNVTYGCDTSYYIKTGSSSAQCQSTTSNTTKWSNDNQPPTCAICCLNCLLRSVCLTWAIATRIAPILPPLISPPCCPVDYYP